MPLIDLIKDQAVLVKVYVEKLNQGENIAEALFTSYENTLNDLISKELKKSDWRNRIPEASKTIREWTAKSGKMQNWHKEDLARAWCVKEVANKFYQNHETELMLLDAFHETVIRYAVKHDLGEKLIEKGKQGLDLLAIEISSRLAKSLNFPGSSAYLSGIIIPYNQKVRTALGEKQEDSLVTKKVVIESAQNAMKLFNAKNVLAETSIAPEPRVRKSRKEPKVFICELQEGKSYEVNEYLIRTHLREKFDSTVRELMYQKLKKMYK